MKMPKELRNFLYTSTIYYSQTFKYTRSCTSCSTNQEENKKSNGLSDLLTKFSATKEDALKHRGVKAQNSPNKSNRWLSVSGLDAQVVESFVQFS